MPQSALFKRKQTGEGWNTNGNSHRDDCFKDQDVSTLALMALNYVNYHNAAACCVLNSPKLSHTARHDFLPQEKCLFESRMTLNITQLD